MTSAPGSLARLARAAARTREARPPQPAPSRAIRAIGATALVTAVVAAVATIVLALVRQLDLEYQWPTVRLALEASGSVIALIATFLVFGRLLRSTYLNELLLASAFVLIAVANLVFVTVPTVAGWAPDDLTLWVGPFTGGLGAILFAMAAFIPRRMLRKRRLVLALAAVSVLVTLALATIIVHAFSDHWNPKWAATITLKSIGHPALQVHPALFGFELLVAVLYAFAATGFLRRSSGLNDEFFGWLALAAVLAAASHINYSLFPSLYSRSVLYTGDIFRFAFYVALFVGCMREIRSYWRVVSEAAVLEERRRIARDLHDGLAQELAYMSRHLDEMAAAATAASADAFSRVRQALERAQLESRRAINALAPAERQPLDVALCAAATEIAERHRLQLDLDLASGIRLSPARAEALVRIACEAITNAARHSGADRVTVQLLRDGSLVRLHVADCGRGFDPAAQAPGFGLMAMHERARSVGGEVRVRSAPGRGSEVRVCV